MSYIYIYEQVVYLAYLIYFLAFLLVMIFIKLALGESHFKESLQLTFH